MSTQLIRLSKAYLINGVLILFSYIPFYGNAFAAGCPPTPLTGGESATISTICDNVELVDAGNLQIQSLGVVNATIAIAIDNSGSTNSISNYGAVNAVINTAADALAIYNRGILFNLNNSDGAVISGMSDTDGSGRSTAGGIANDGGTITTLTNSGASVISGVATNTGDRYGIGVANSGGMIGTLINQDSAVIRGETAGTSNAFGVFNVGSGTIGTINNSGSVTISGKTTGSGFAYGVLNNGGTITTLNNSGSATISGESVGSGGAYGVAASNFIDFSANITTLNNSDSAIISATSIGAGEAVGVEVFASTIGSINNSGSAAISASSQGGRDAFGVRVKSSTVDTINNTGLATISGITNISGITTGGLEAIGIRVESSTIGSINNSDSAIISGKSDGLSAAVGIDVFPNSVIDIINNGSSANIFGINTGSGDVYGIYNEASTIGTLNNYGTISATANGIGAAYGVFNTFEASFTTLNNIGLISAVSVGGTGIGIFNEADSTIITLTNSGTISGEGNGSGFFNSGIITTLTNSGTISGGFAGISNIGAITTLNNLGTISGGENNYGIFNGDASTIISLNNSGMISSGDNGVGIVNDSSIVTLNNSGTISGGIGGGVGIVTMNITTLNNTGTIFTEDGGIGIRNNGTINFLNNAQGGNSSSPAMTALIYAGILPNNYNIILNSLTHYGQLATQTPSGVTTFGISSLSRKNSTILNTTLASVLSGVTPEQLGFTGLSSFSGLSNGFSYTLYLTDLATNTWGLIVTGCNNCDIYSGMSVTSNDIDVTVYPVLAGGTLVLNNADNVSQAFSVTANSMITSPSIGTATLSGVFSGAGGLVFNGSGTTVLTGANSYSGGTTVSAGTLSVAGSSPTGTGAVIVASGGTLMGRGTITGSVNVSGVLKPGNSPGYLSTTSTVTMNAGSSYVQDIAGTVQASSTSPVGATGYYSFLNVTNGQFVIQPGSTFTPQLSNLFTADQSGFGSAIYVPGLGDRLRIVTAVGGISGKFSTVTQPAELAAGTQFLPFYNMAGSNSIDLAVIPTSYQTTIAAASGNANAQSVGGVLTQLAQSSLAGTATAAQDQWLYAISGQTTAQGIANFAQSMSGEVYAANVAVMAQTTQRTQHAVLNRLGDTAGLGMTGQMVSPNLSTQAGGAPSAAVSSNPNVDPKAEAKSFSKGNVWGELAYQRGSRSSDSQSGGWSSSLYQLTFGSDFYSYNGTIAGAGLALSSTTLNPAYGSSTIQQGSLFAYGKMPVESFVVDAMASVGLSASDIKRGDVTGLSSGFRSNSVSGNDVMLSLGLSRPFDTESVRVTPYARVTWQMVTQSSVNEGDVGSALSVNGYTGSGVRGVIGIAAGSKANNPMTNKNTYRAYLGIGADSSGLLNPTLNASLVGINTNIMTPNAGTTFVQAGLYGTAKMSENTFAYAGISGEARSGQTLGSINVGLKVQF